MKNLSPELGGRFNTAPAKEILRQTMGGKLIIDHNLYKEIKCNIHNGSSEYFLKPSLFYSSMGDSEKSNPKTNLPSEKVGEQTKCCNQQSKGASCGTPGNSFKKKLFIYKKTNDASCKNILDMAVSVFQPVYHEISTKSELCNGQRGNSIHGLSCLNLDVSAVDKSVRRSKSSPSLGEKNNSGIYFYNSSDESTEHMVSNESPRNNRQTNISVTLASLLENIPLAYSPLTKQLHYIKSEKSDKKSMSTSDAPNEIIDRTRQLESIDEIEASEMHIKVNIVDKKEFHESPRNTLQRVATNTSLCRTDASSFSGISSLSTNTDFSTSASINDELSDIRGIFGEGEETSGTDGQSRTSCDRSRSNSNSSSDFYDEKQAIAQGAKPKRRGLTSFLTRSLFSRKTKEQQNAIGWKLFCKVPAKETFSDKDVSPRENKGNRSPVCGSKCRNEIVASSTTALILENRPANLPAKPVEEEQKHRQQYEQMVEAAKKRELKEAKLRKKQFQQQLKQEEQLSNAIRQWNSEILPNWEIMKNSRKARDLWWQGLPPSIRGKVWKQAIGNDLNITPELYEICVNRAKDRIQIGSDSASTEEQREESSSDKEATVELIQLDVSRTFPQLCIFQKGGPYYDMLHSLLGAYVCYRPDVGYVQGMSFLAAVLILNLEVADAFISFANLLNKPCHMAYFRLDEPMMKSYFTTYEEFFEESLPRLYEHFNKQNLSPDLYLTDWIYTLYSKSLPLDVASRVWDVFCRDGEEFLFRTALGILHMYEDILINMDFIHLAQFLTKLPEDITGESLFKSIDNIKMLKDKQKFNQVLSSHCEAIGQSIPIIGH